MDVVNTSVVGQKLPSGVMPDAQNTAKTPFSNPLFVILASIATLIIGICILPFFVITNTITIRDQSLDGGIYVDEISLTRGGYLLVRGIDETEDYFAYSTYLPPGRYKDFFLPRLGADISRKTLQPGDYLVAELWENKKGEIGFSGVPIFHPESSEKLHFLFGGIARKVVHVQ